MKNTAILLAAFFTFISAKSGYQTNELLYINHINKLKLLTIDDKCGE